MEKKLKADILACMASLDSCNSASRLIEGFADKVVPVAVFPRQGDEEPSGDALPRIDGDPGEGDTFFPRRLERSVGCQEIGQRPHGLPQGVSPISTEGGMCK